MTISASEISDLIKQKIEGVDLDAQTKTTGSILSVKDGVVRLYGIKDTMCGEMLDLPGGSVAMASTSKVIVLVQWCWRLRSP